MTILYVATGLLIIFLNIDKLPLAFASIFKGAFTATSVAGGFAGAAVRYTVRMGVARGIFSNESGLGTAPIAHAAARTDWPAREGLVAMIGPYVDSILINSMTTLVIVMSGQWMSGLDGAPVTAAAFGWGIPVGRFIVSISLALFAYSTTLSWFYYGDRGVDYWGGDRARAIYKWVYLIFLPIGAVSAIKFVWYVGDITYGLMSIPNLIAIFFLSGRVVKYTREYFQAMKNEETH